MDIIQSPLKTIIWSVIVIETRENFNTDYERIGILVFTIMNGPSQEKHNYVNMYFNGLEASFQYMSHLIIRNPL